MPEGVFMATPSPGIWTGRERSFLKKRFIKRYLSSWQYSYGSLASS